MKRARIALFEDDKTHIDRLSQFLDLFQSQHEIVVTERSLPKALACIDAIRRGDVLANVIVFDANLTGATKQLGHDAVCIADAIQAANLTVHAIGYSALPMSRFGVAVAEDAQKDPFRLIEILDDLPENQPTNSQD